MVVHETPLIRNWLYNNSTTLWLCYNIGLFVQRMSQGTKCKDTFFTTLAELFRAF